MTRTWEFTDLEFKVLWERQLQQRILPEPLTYMSRTPLRDDYEREKFQIWERLRDTVDGSMLEVISRPEVL